MSELERGWNIPVSNSFRPQRSLPARVKAFLDGIKVGERRAWVPDSLPQAGENRFYVLRDDVIFPDGEYLWTNGSPTGEDRGGGGHGFSRIKQTPVFRIDTRAPLRLFDIWNRSGCWMVSERALNIFRQFDADAVDYIKVDAAHVSGERYDFPVYWMDITRGMHAYDVENSNLVFINSARVGLRVERAHNLVRIRRDIDSKVHVFREGGDSGDLYVSAELRAALEVAKLISVGFDDVATGRLVKR